MLGEIQIRPVESPQDLAAARTLFAAYADWLERDHGIDLAFQGIEAELAGLPGKYALPEGALLLALSTAGAAVGCAALRPHAQGVCEMKRLYVAPEARGTGLGRRLAKAILAEGRSRGYARMLLDTGGFMDAAQGLYRSLGFREIPAYYHNPIPGCLFMACDLVDPA
ncbi:MAG: GNAT family N-acetyltransferase [Pseudomonadota bacterium]